MSVMEDLLLHDATRAAFTAFTEQPPQGLLLVGPEGVGKVTIATTWARTITNHPTNIRLLAPDERGTIGIETIRGLYKAARTKQERRQVIIIDRADHMSLEAENAFLKLLEEPRSGLTFVLTTLKVESLLPTIVSRVQHVDLRPLPDTAIRRLIMAKKPGVTEADLAQLVFLAQGRPGIALGLLAEDSLPKQRERMQIVKQLLTAKPYERFRHIGALATDRASCIASLEAMMRIVEVQTISTTNPAQLQHWITIANALEETLTNITNNGNIRAQLLYLFSAY